MRQDYCGSGLSFLRPFFFLCLLEDSSDLSNSGLTLPLMGAFPATGVAAVISFGRSGASPAFSTGGRDVLAGPTDLSGFASGVPVAAGMVSGVAALTSERAVEVVEPEFMISTPMELPAGVELAGAFFISEDAASAPLSGTGWKESGAFDAGADAGAAASLAEPSEAGAEAIAGSVAALGLIADEKSEVMRARTVGARVGLGSERLGSPSCAVRTVSGECMMKKRILSVMR